MWAHFASVHEYAIETFTSFRSNLKTQTRLHEDWIAMSVADFPKVYYE